MLLDKIMNTPFQDLPVSVCQCVSADFDNENAKPESGPRSGGRRKKTPVVTLWPQAIPRGDRIPLQIGHRSFAAAYLVDPPPTIRTRKVEIRGHCLVYVENAQILIGRSDLQHLLGPGDAALLSDTTATISELPAVDGTAGGAVYFFFGDEELAELVPVNPRANMLLFRSAEFPCAEGFLPFQKVPMRFVYDPAVGIRGLVHPLLTLMFNQITLPLWKLCLRRVVIPRIRLQIFLENLVLRPAKDHGRILEKFPGGKSALLREMRRLKLPSIAAGVEQRRLELCIAWHVYGGRELDDVIRALCVAQPGRFRAKYERWVADEKTFKLSGLGTGYADTLLAAHPPYIPSIRGKYWLRRDYEMDVLPRHHEKMKTDENYRGQIEFATAAVERDPSILEGGLDFLNPLTPSRQIGQVDPMFWHLESTGIGMIIEAEGLTSIPGLEDCAELLMAA